MARNILEIYKEYKIPPFLQLHMLRVSAVAKIICDSFTEPLPEEDIIATCLLHDMGNIIKVNFTFFPEAFDPEGVEYWQKVQEEYKNKYGADEEQATEIIMEELGASRSVLELKGHVGFEKIPQNEKSSVFTHKICNYADMRVSPHGVVSMMDRIEEGHKRFLSKNISRPYIYSDFEEKVKSAQNIEKQIFAKCKIKPEDITEEAVQPLISELRNFVIK